uniref:cytochrome c oxidase subunit III n=1 Tax=Miroplana shenzhensis TaxID=2597322 RepID=UPI001FAE982F
VWEVVFSIVCIFFGLVFSFGNYNFSKVFFFIGIFFLIFNLIRWSINIGSSILDSFRSISVFAFLTFVTSEVVIFSLLFSSLLASSTSSGIYFSPLICDNVTGFNLPSLATCCLAVSSFSVTKFHYSLVCGNSGSANKWLFFTIFYGVVFVCIQFVEYVSLPISISTSVGGTYLFSITGLHGSHVIMGLVLLYLYSLMNNFRLSENKLYVDENYGLCAIIYWHFVDLVWVCVYSLVYIYLPYVG